MQNLARRIYQAMIEKGYSYGELSRVTGIPKSALQRYATGETGKVPLDRLAQLAHVLEVSPTWLMGLPAGEPGPAALEHPDLLPLASHAVPLLGEIACGRPRYAQEQAEVFVVPGGEIHCDFALRARGDSMTGARIFDGDIVFIKRQADVDNGEIAAVILDEEATLKRIRRLPGGMTMLEAANPAYDPILIGGEDETRSVHILGKAVAFQSPL